MKANGTSFELLNSAFSQNSDVKRTANLQIQQSKATRLTGSERAEDENLTNSSHSDPVKNNTELQQNMEGLDEAVSVISKFIDSNGRGINFAVDDKTNKTVITIVDRKTNETIRQLPSEELLRISETIKKLEEDFSNKVGILIDNIV